MRKWLVKLSALASATSLVLLWPSTVYCDPFTAFAATWYGAIIISASISAASMGIQYLAQKKAKVANVDRGKIDDIRASVPGYGEFIPKGWGVFRIAPVWIWESPAVDHPVTTPGHSGGKMPSGGGATPSTTDHVYLKSVAGVFHDGEIYGGVRRIWFDNDLVASFLTSEAIGGSLDGTISTRKYEAEFGALAGGAAVSTQAECSGAKKVTGIGSGGTCTLRALADGAGSYDLAVHYTSLSSLTFKVSVNGGASVDLVCPASGGATIVAIQTMTVTLIDGSNTIAFANAGAACPDLDCIDLAPGRGVTPIDPRQFVSVIDPNKLPPTDQAFSWSYYNFIPDPGDGGGAGGTVGTPASTFNLGKYGQPSIRIYRGTRTQNADSAIVAQEGADRASAYRGFAVIMIEGIQLQGGRMPNVTLEVDQGVHSVPVIAEDIYSLVGRQREQLNLTALAGLQLGDSTIDPGTYADATWQNKTNSTSGSGGAITKTSGTDDVYNAGASHNATLAAATNGAIRFTPSAGTFAMGWSTSASPTTMAQILFGLETQLWDVGETRLTIRAVISGVSVIEIGRWAPGDSMQIEIREGRFRAYQNGIELGGFSPPVASFPLYPAFIGYLIGGGVTATSVSLAGAIGDAPSSNAGGLLLSSRRSAGDLLSDLQTRFQFDMVEVDGVVKAILRSTSSDSVPLVSSFTPSSLRSDGTGWLGVRFNTGTNTPSIVSLGRWRVSGNTGTHALRLYKSDGILIASASVDMSTGTVGAFKYAAITPVTLLASTNYYLFSQEVIGGDQWYDASPITINSSIASSASAAYAIPLPTLTDTGVANNSYVAVDLQKLPTDVLIPYTDMRAVVVEPGSLPELPAYDCQINDIDPILLPARVDVNYLDPGMDYHNNTQTDFKLADEPEQDNQSVSLSIVDSADNMKKLAIILRNKAKMEGRTFSWQTSWKYMHVHPGTIATLALANATHTVRVVQAKYALPAGVIEFQGVRQAPSLYSPTATGSISSGFEAPIAAIPANTKGVIIDGPLLRAEDAGDGTQPVIYIGMCGRGSGAWQGAFLYQEFPRGSGNYSVLLTTATQASQIGVTVGALAAVSDPSVFDRVNSLVINFYTPTVLESVTETEILQNPELNLLGVVKPTTGEVEYVQFSVASAGVPVAPYLSKYTVSGFLRGRAGTDGNVGIHAAGDDVVVIDSTVKPRRMELSDIGA